MNTMVYFKVGGEMRKYVIDEFMTHDEAMAAIRLGPEKPDGAVMLVYS